jgi:hypothetical protein
MADLAGPAANWDTSQSRYTRQVRGKGACGSLPSSSRRNDLPVLCVPFDLAAQPGRVLEENSERLS